MENNGSTFVNQIPHFITFYITNSVLLAFPVLQELTLAGFLCFRVVYYTGYRQVYQLRSQTTYRCCPGWSQLTGDAGCLHSKCCSAQLNFLGFGSFQENALKMPLNVLKNVLKKNCNFLKGFFF